MTAPSTIAPPQDSAAVSGSDHRLVVRSSNHQPTRLNELHLFAGCGGGILGGILLGHEPVCAVEINPYARRCLLQRQRDGILPPFPIWDDVTTFDGTPWNGIADVVCGGFPCQDLSEAGNGAGIDGARSGLWREMFRIVCEVRPRFVFVENSPMLVRGGLARVLGNLASVRYDARWCVIGSGSCAAPHDRERTWVLAWDTDRRHDFQKQKVPGRIGQIANTTGGRWWDTEPGVGRVADGVANRHDRNHAAGNGQVPLVAAVAWRMLEGAGALNSPDNIPVSNTDTNT